jgi:hypothetical protein
VHFLVLPRGADRELRAACGGIVLNNGAGVPTLTALAASVASSIQSGLVKSGAFGFQAIGQRRGRSRPGLSSAHQVCSLVIEAAGLEAERSAGSTPRIDSGGLAVQFRNSSLQASSRRSVSGSCLAQSPRMDRSMSPQSSWQGPASESGDAAGVTLCCVVCPMDVTRSGNIAGCRNASWRRHGRSDLGHPRKYALFSLCWRPVLRSGIADGVVGTMSAATCRV